MEDTPRNTYFSKIILKLQCASLANAEPIFRTNIFLIGRVVQLGSRCELKESRWFCLESCQQIVLATWTSIFQAKHQDMNPLLY